MRILMGLVLAGGILLGTAGESKAQFSLSIGNPYTGQGLSIGTPGYGYGYGGLGYSGLGYPGVGYSSFASPGYGSVYNSYSTTGYLAGPGTFQSYSSGYRGIAPAYNSFGYVGRPYGYGTYGYRSYNNGFRPGRGFGRMFR